MSAYDKIARRLRPVVAERRRGRAVLRRGGGAVAAGRCSSSASAPGGSRCRSRRRASSVVGVDLSAGMLEVARERAELAGVELDLRQGDMRDPPRRRDVPARHLPVPLAAPHGDGRRPAPGPSGRVPAFVEGTWPVRLRRLYPVRGGHRRHARPLPRARARDLGARGLGRGDAHADPAAPQPGRRSRRCRSPGFGSRVAAAPRRGRVRGRGAATAGSTARRGAAAKTPSGCAGRRE